MEEFNSIVFFFLSFFLSYLTTPHHNASILFIIHTELHVDAIEISLNLEFSNEYLIFNFELRRTKAGKLFRFDGCYLINCIMLVISYHKELNVVVGAIDG